MAMGRTLEKSGARADLAPETALTRDWQSWSRPHVVSDLQKIPLSLGFPKRTICVLVPSQDCLEGSHEPSQKVSAIEEILGGHLINPPGFTFEQTEAQKKQLGQGCRGQWLSEASVSRGRSTRRTALERPAGLRQEGPQGKGWCYQGKGMADAVEGQPRSPQLQCNTFTDIPLTLCHTWGPSLVQEIPCCA